MNKPRAWLEIFRDIINLMLSALATPAGLELLDELGQVLDLPDVFPNVDGLQSDDEGPTVETVMRRHGAASVTSEPASGDKTERKHASLSDVLGGG